MEDFVAVFGELPDGACKLRDYDARYHSDTWIQRLLGEGIVCDYVVGYQLEDKWWTFCFDRREEVSADDEEVWVVEGYDSAGGSSRESYLYCPALGWWRRLVRAEGNAQGSTSTLKNEEQYMAPPRASAN